MGEVLTQFKPGWIKNKNEGLFEPNFQRILLFYLFSTPCDGVSSSGINLASYGWGKNIWINSKLKEILLEVAKLQDGKNYIKCKKLEEMTASFDGAGLNDGFHKRKFPERIAFYHDGKRNEFITILFYIRCALAHGRFEIYKTEGENVYVMEAIKLAPKGYSSRARMIFKESTLIRWIEILTTSSDKLEVLYSTLERNIQDAILHQLDTQTIRNKHELASQIDCEDCRVFTQLNKLRKSNMIIYDNRKRVWRKADAVDKAS